MLLRAPAALLIEQRTGERQEGGDSREEMENSHPCSSSLTLSLSMLPPPLSSHHLLAFLLLPPFLTLLLFLSSPPVLSSPVGSPKLPLERDS